MMVVQCYIPPAGVRYYGCATTSPAVYERADWSHMALEHLDAIEACLIPNSHGAVIAARAQAASGNGQRPDRIRVAGERLDAHERVQVPYLDGGVSEA